MVNFVHSGNSRILSLNTCRRQEVQCAPLKHPDLLSKNSVHRSDPDLSPFLTLALLGVGDEEDEGAKSTFPHPEAGRAETEADSLNGHFQKSSTFGGESPRGGEGGDVNPQPQTPNSKSSTLNPQPLTLPYTLNRKLSTLNPQPSTLNPQLSTLHPQPSIINS